jgi:hypothetical protein
VDPKHGAHGGERSAMLHTEEVDYWRLVLGGGGRPTVHAWRRSMTDGVALGTGR